MESLYTLNTTYQQRINVNIGMLRKSYLLSDHILSTGCCSIDKLCNLSSPNNSQLISNHTLSVSCIFAAFYHNNIRSYMYNQPQSSWPRMAPQDVHSWFTYLLQQKQWPHWRWPTLLIGWFSWGREELEGPCDSWSLRHWNC